MSFSKALSCSSSLTSMEAFARDLGWEEFSLDRFGWGGGGPPELDWEFSLDSFGCRGGSPNCSMSYMS
jgi:hypothetical protein